MCAVHMQNMKSLVLLNGSGEEGLRHGRIKTVFTWGLQGKDAAESQAFELA